MKKLPLILASSSPRRKKILSNMGYDFTIISPDVEESNYESARKTVSENAKLKAEFVSKQHLHSYVIAADTVVSLDDHILGKPKNIGEAQLMLKSLSGRQHDVLTGVSIRGPQTSYDFVEISEVEFKELTEEIIQSYFSKCNPLDKAGAYNIDEYGDLIIEKIFGSYTNIMGLPDKTLYEYLKKIKF